MLQKVRESAKVVSVGARTNVTIDADGVELLRWKSTSS